MNIPREIRARAVVWSYAGVALTLLMGLVCPLSQFGGEMLWHGTNIAGIFGAALFSSMATWGCLGILWLAATRARPWAGRLLRLAVAVGVIVIAIDALVVMIFGLRFDARDTFAFGHDPKTWASFASLGLGHMKPAFVLAAVLLCWTLVSLPVFVWHQPPPTRGRQLAIGLSIAACGITLGALPIDLGPVRRFAVCSVWELVVCDTRGKGYSGRFKARVAERINAVSSAVLIDAPPGRPQRPNIALLVIESWSNYQSRLFGGLRDWTPELDAAASRGIAFTNFIANGFTTEDGLIAILLGEEPIAPATARPGVLLGNFVGFHGAERALPRLLAQAGYRSYFFTNGPLDFARLHQFLDSIGCDFLNDGADPFYRQRPDGTPWPRGCFGAADEALYARVRSFLEAAHSPEGDGDRKAPFMVVLETTSSHLPLTCPDGPPHTEERVMRYVDREAGRFIRGLTDDGFFRAGGLLVVLSDHRAMLPINADEMAAFGSSSVWRIPLFLLADWLPRGHRDGRLASQADIATTLEWLTTGSTPMAGRRGILARPETPPGRFQAARQPADRSAIAAWDTQTGAAGTIRWNGDRSSASPGLEDALLWLTWERIARESRLSRAPEKDAPLRHARWLGDSGAEDPAHR